MADGRGRAPAPAGQRARVDTSSHGPLAARTTFWQRTFAALRHPNYRLWGFGQPVSLVGPWLQITAQSFLVTPGHNVEVWLEPKYQVLIANALRWCGGNQAT